MHGLTFSNFQQAFSYINKTIPAGSFSNLMSTCNTSLFFLSFLSPRWLTSYARGGNGSNDRQVGLFNVQITNFCLQNRKIRLLIPSAFSSPFKQKLYRESKLTCQSLSPTWEFQGQFKCMFISGFSISYLLILSLRAFKMLKDSHF